jgi:hypothetical protein
MLGSLYLWIDYLCIIQDDKNDWEVESAMMGRYHKQAQLTIAAEDDKTAAEGYFRPRNPDAVRPCTVLVSFASSKDHDDVYKDLYIHHSSSHQHNFKSNIPETNLQLRGWCF